MKWVYLFIAIVAEIIATSSLKASDGLSKIVPTTITLSGYAVAFFFLSLVLKEIPVGIAYAIWSAVGMVLVALIGYFYFKQPLDTPAIIGLVFIIIGVVIINVFSKSVEM